MLLKKTTVALIALGVSTAASAFYLPNVKHSTPDSFFFGAEGIYVQPNDNLAYADLPSSSSFRTVHFVDPDYEFGFSLWAGYHYAHRQDDLTVNWTHLINTSDTDSVVDGNAKFEGKGKFDFDKITAIYAHTFMEDLWSFRLGTGVQYADIRKDLTIDQTDAQTNAFQGSIGQESKYDGIGPQIETDVLYHLDNGFGFTAHLATALLIGDREADINLHIAGTTHHFDATSTTEVVPALDGRIGLNWTHDFGSTGPEGIIMGPTLTIEGGWQAATYIDAFERIGAGPNVVSGSSNFTYQGPYLGLQLNI